MGYNDLLGIPKSANPARQEVWFARGNGYASVNTSAFLFADLKIIPPCDSMVADISAAYGARVKIIRQGLYIAQFQSKFSAGDRAFGIILSQNDTNSNLTSDPSLITDTTFNRGMSYSSTNANRAMLLTSAIYCYPGDIINVTGDGGVLDGTHAYFRVFRAGD